MLTEEDVEQCLREGREALALLADLLGTGQRTTGEVFLRARAELDALASLLDEAPEAKRGDVVYVIERYEALLRSTSN